MKRKPRVRSVPVGDGPVVVSARLPSDLVLRLDAETDARNAKRSWPKLTRSTAIRELLGEALASRAEPG
jgi:hypothetical protein